MDNRKMWRIVSDSIRKTFSAAGESLDKKINMEKEVQEGVYPGGRSNSEYKTQIERWAVFITSLPELQLSVVRCVHSRTARMRRRTSTLDFSEDQESTVSLD